MRQLIARVDDRLYDDLKARARAEGRSMNALVNEALEAAVASSDERRVVFERIHRAGLAVFPPPAMSRMTRDEAIASTRGTGTAVSRALKAERSAR